MFKIITNIVGITNKLEIYAGKIDTHAALVCHETKMYLFLSQIELYQNDQICANGTDQLERN